MSVPPLRLALLGAFAFPAPLGSQRYFAEQAEALRAAGASVDLLTYPERGHALRGLDLRKLAADRALGARLAAAHRAKRFDAVLAHNAEAALVALAARARGGPPVVYVVHALWAEELPTWLPLPGAHALGAALDRRLARRADAVLVLTAAAEAALAPHAEGPVARIAPGYTEEPAPSAEAVAAACARHGLAREGYAIYAGNLDRYQDVAVLAAVTSALPVVAVTHAAGRARFARLRVVETASVEEARCLVQGAAVALLPRRGAGGFPIKLLHYLAAARPTVLRAAHAGALVHGESAWVLPGDAGPGAFGAALDRLAADAALRARLGAGALRALAAHHAWPARAAETLALARAALSAPRSRR